MKEIFGSLVTREIEDSPPSLKFPIIISISGKGGVGKTNIVINLAFAFAKLHKNVFLLDGDLGLPNIHTLLGLVPKYNISHFIKQQEMIWQFLIDGPRGIRILPGSSGDLQLMNLNAREKVSLIGNLELVAKTIDIFLIDTESGLSSNVLFFNMMASNSIIIITPEPTSINNAQALIKELSKKTKKKKIAILVNCVRNKEEGVKVFEKFVKIVDRSLGTLLSLDFWGFVPFDQKLQEAVRKQRAVLDMCPQAPSSCSFMRVAKRILERVPSQREGSDYPFLYRPVSKYYLPGLHRTDDGNKDINLES